MDLNLRVERLEPGDEAYLVLPHRRIVWGRGGVCIMAPGLSEEPVGSDKEFESLMQRVAAAFGLTCVMRTDRSAYGPVMVFTKG